VLQVVYAFDQSKLRAYPGMLLDVFIEMPAGSDPVAIAPTDVRPASGGGEPVKKP
jgi:hypothetical protein